MNMTMKMMVAAAGTVAVLSASAITEAIAYQGRIQRNDGKPFQAAQSLPMTFQVCDTNAEDAILWSRTIPVRVGTDGSFYVELSDQNGTADPSVPNQVSLARACGNASAVQIRLMLPDSSANTKAFRETLKAYSHVDHALFARQADEAVVHTLKCDSVVVNGDLKVSGNLIVSDAITFSRILTLDVTNENTVELPGETVSFPITGWTLDESGTDKSARDRIVTLVRNDSFSMDDKKQAVSIPVCWFGKQNQPIPELPSGAQIKQVQSLK